MGKHKKNKKANHIVRPALSIGNNIMPSEDRIEDIVDYPVFCFKHLSDDSFKILDKSQRSVVIQKLFNWSKMKWQHINTLGKHQAGFELIPIKKVSGFKKPAFLTPDITQYHVFRYQGKRAMIGHKSRSSIFHIFHFDNNFTSYNHNH